MNNERQYRVVHDRDMSNIIGYLSDGEPVYGKTPGCLAIMARTIGLWTIGPVFITLVLLHIPASWDLPINAHEHAPEQISPTESPQTQPSENDDD